MNPTCLNSSKRGLQGSTAQQLRIGIVGNKGHGKDTVADRLCEHHRFRRVAFADPMKRMLQAGLGIPEEVLWGPAEVKERPVQPWGVSVRHMLQTIGTEWGRDLVHPELWTRLALERTIPEYEAGHGPQRWVVSDVRFVNEAELLASHGFLLLRVLRPGYDTGQHNEHVSETELASIEVDVTIENDSTIFALHARVDRMFQPLPSRGYFDRRAPRG